MPNINTFITVIFFACNLLTNHVAFSQQAKTIVNKKNILIGEQISYNILIQKSTAANTATLQIPDTINHFEVVDKITNDTTISNIQFLNTTLVFTSFDSGSFYFPPLKYNVNGTNFFTDSIKVDIGYMPIDKSNVPRDIKTIIEVDYFNWFWYKMVLVILTIFIAMFFLYKYFAKKKSSSTLNTTNNSYAQAMDALHNLQKQNANNTIEPNELYSSLTTIFKTYYSSIKHTNMLSKTSEQVLQNLISMQLNNTTMLHTKEAFTTGDATKFAKYNPLTNENEIAIGYIKNTINEIEKLNNPQ